MDMNYFKPRTTFKDYILGILLLVGFGAVYLLCTEVLPSAFSYGWIAVVVLFIAEIIGCFALYGPGIGFIVLVLSITIIVCR